MMMVGKQYIATRFCKNRNIVLEELHIAAIFIVAGKYKIAESRLCGEIM